MDASLLKLLGEDAFPYLDTLLRIGTDLNDKNVISTGLNNKGIVWYYKGDLKKSSELYYLALAQVGNGPEYYTLKARIKNNLGWNLLKVENYTRALTMFEEAEMNIRLANNDTILGSILNNKAVVEKTLEDYDNALQTLEESAAINRRLQNNQQVRFNLNNMGVVLTELGRYTQAMDTLKKVLSQNYLHADTLEISNNLLNLGIAAYNLGEMDSANYYLEEALLIVTDPMLRRKIYLAIDESMIIQQDYKNALGFAHKFMLITDSINNVKTQEYVLDLDSKYNTLMKERELNKAELNLANQRKMLYLILGALLILIILALFLTYFIRIKIRNEKSLKALNYEIKKQAEELSESNEKISRINENLESIVSERTLELQNRNERLLHFSFLNSHRIRGPVASLLGLVNMLNDNNNNQDKTKIQEHLQLTVQKLDNMVREVTRKLENDEVNDPEN